MELALTGIIRHKSTGLPRGFLLTEVDGAGFNGRTRQFTVGDTKRMLQTQTINGLCINSQGNMVLSTQMAGRFPVTCCHTWIQQSEYRTAEEERRDNEYEWFETTTRKIKERLERNTKELQKKGVIKSAGDVAIYDEDKDYVSFEQLIDGAGLPLQGYNTIVVSLNFQMGTICAAVKNNQVQAACNQLVVKTKPRSRPETVGYRKTVTETIGMLCKLLETMKKDWTTI